jgi:hypothetical protein
MSSLNQIYRGKSIDPAFSLKLQAGHVCLFFCDGAIRTITAGDHEIVRMIYVAVRDGIWNTVRHSVSNLVVDAEESSFTIDFDCRHKKGDVDFIWHGSISGTPESTIRFSMKGEALSSFQSNRISFCVLHPLDECSGKPCTILTARGEKKTGRFPLLISPHQPFKNMRGIIQKSNGLESRIFFKGDTFEMEDQRNWTDASFKTYCPPLSRPHPVMAKKGDCFSQEIEIQVSGGLLPQRKRQDAGIPIVKVDTKSAAIPLPEIGCTGGSNPTAGEKKTAGLLCLQHVRVNVEVGQSFIVSAFRRASRISRGLGVPLELAFYFSKEPLKKQIVLMREMLRTFKLPIKRFLVFRKGETVTSGATMKVVLPVLRGEVPGADVVTGTDSYFVEINRDQPELRGSGGVCYSVNPQVHTFDDRSILENLEGQFYTVESAHRLGHGVPVYVTPITLAPRLNPDLPEKFHGPDPRQKSLLGAVWTLGSVIQLCRANAAGATYFELTGPCGVMEKQGRKVFPLFHVLADVNEFYGGAMRVFPAGPENAVTGCMLEKQGRKRFLFANTAMEAREIVVAGIPGTVFSKALDETTFAEACLRPEEFRRKKGERVRPVSGRVRLKMLPYGIIKLDN